MATIINPSNQTITQYNIQTGGASNLLNNVAPSATSGIPVISQGASAQPVFGTAVVAGGGTGNATQAAYSLVCGGTTTTGAFQAVSDVATGSVLISGGTGALPSFSAAPSVTSITLSGGTALSNYVEGTFTPTIAGHTVAGTTTYTNQIGYYQRIGNMAFINAVVTWTNATGTGGIDLGGLPFTVNTTLGFMPASIYSLSLLVAGSTYIQPIFQGNTTLCRIFGVNTATGTQISSDLTANTNCTLIISGFYKI